MREGRGGLGFFDGVGVGNADEIVMPLTPHRVAVLGRESRDAAPSEADRYNTLQVRIAQHHVHLRIGSNLASFVRSLPRSEAAADPVPRPEKGRGPGHTVISSHAPAAAAKPHARQEPELVD